MTTTKCPRPIYLSKQSTCFEYQIESIVFPVSKRYLGRGIAIRNNSGIWSEEQMLIPEKSEAHCLDHGIETNVWDSKRQKQKTPRVSDWGTDENWNVWRAGERVKQWCR